MSRLFGALSVFLAALAACLGTATLGTVASAQDAFVTRIEPRSYYGATITVEEGVRVFRPLPPTRQIIINPTQTPLNLSYSETVERRYASDNAGASDDNGNGDASNGSNSSEYANGNGGDVTTSYPNYGSALTYGDERYRRRSNGDSYSGRRLRGFGHHGVRVNGQLASHYSGDYSGLGGGFGGGFGYGKPQRPALTAFGQHRKAKPAPAHLPMGYGNRHPGFIYSSGYGRGGKSSNQTFGPHMPMQNFKVQRAQPAPVRQAPMITHAYRPPVMPHHAAIPVAPRMIHAPVNVPRTHAAPQNAGHGHAAPAGRMGMGRR
jgi:hypothetical protein